ncbi:complement C1q-like protein 2 [Mugil cephalus]|uniref:complement C1q-like protein 2 n=1 Tax=Mugil cephalus TaxID=48193 RepID=UPI001FB7C949|nr:complement C1q-like protein 2 [Mugil cephalus]
MEHFFLLLLLVSSRYCAGNAVNPEEDVNLPVCQPDTCTLLTEVAGMREKLSATAQTQSALEQRLNDLMQKLAAAEASLGTYKQLTEELSKTNQAQDEQLKTLFLTTSSTGQKKAAFTVALGTPEGPYTEDVPVKYQRIVSNIGTGYNPATGVFTAMMRGMYYFCFTMYNNNAGQPNSVVSLMMNHQRVVSTWDTEGQDTHDSATNAAVLLLEPGDNVYVKLYAKRVLYDDDFYYNTFSGFLLYPM